MEMYEKREEAKKKREKGKKKGSSQCLIVQKGHRKGIDWESQEVDVRICGLKVQEKKKMATDHTHTYTRTYHTYKSTSVCVE